MLPPAELEVMGPGPDLSFRIRLLHETNPDVTNALLGLLPLQSFFLHVVVAGETIYAPAPSITLLGKNMVERRPGTVYWNTTSQSICFCYGVVSESTLVNEFARVEPEHLPKLAQLGRQVYEQTVVRRVPTIVQVVLDVPREATTISAPFQPHSRPVRPRPKPSLDGDEGQRAEKADWRRVKSGLDDEAVLLRFPEEPDEIKRIRLGAVASRSGGGESSPLQTTVFLQGFLSTLGPHIFSRLLLLSNDPEMTLSLMLRQTRVFLVDVFNHFDFLGDLGLDRMRDLGRQYADALETLSSLAEYRALTDSMRTLIQLFYRWLHLIFPWYLKDEFPGRSREEVAGMPNLEVYRQT